MPSQLLALSRSLARVLRHDLHLLSADEDGWCPLDEVLQLPEVTGWSEWDLETVIQESFSKDRPRFEMETRSDGRWVRATHKHSSRTSGYGRTTGRTFQAPSRTEQPQFAAAHLVPPRLRGGAPQGQQQETETTSEGRSSFAAGPQAAKAAPPRFEAREAPPGGQGPAAPQQVPPRRQPPAGGEAAPQVVPPRFADKEGAQEVPPRRRPPATEEAAVPQVVPPRPRGGNPPPPAATTGAPAQAGPQEVPPRRHRPEHSSEASGERTVTSEPAGSPQCLAPSPPKVQHRSPPPVFEEEPAAAAATAGGGLDPWAGGNDPWSSSAPSSRKAPGLVPPRRGGGPQAASRDAGTKVVPPRRQVEQAAAFAAVPRAAAEATEAEAAAAEEPPSAMPVGSSSLGASWSKFALPEEQGGGSWWHCTRSDGQEDYFLERVAAPWQQYAEPSGRTYWWNADTDEFFYATEAGPAQ